MYGGPHATTGRLGAAGQPRLPLDRYRVFETTSVAMARADVTMFSRMASFQVLGDEAGFRLQVNSLLLGDVRLSVVATTGHVVRVEDETHAAVLLPWRGQIATDDGRQEQRARAGTIALPRPGLRATRVPSGYAGLVAQVPLGALRAAAAINPADPPWPGWSDGAGLDAPGSAGLVRYLRYLVAELDAGDALLGSRRTAQGAAAMLTGLLLDCFRRAQEDDAPAPSAGLARVREAEALMRARLQDQISVPMIAARVGVSTRALQAAFRQHRGTTPRAFLGMCRLEAVRERLLGATPGESVTAAALACGVTHLGRFSVEYRARFGEPPSATLARAAPGLRPTARSSDLRPEGPSPRMRAAGSPAKPSRADARRPAPEGHEGETFVRSV